jgi:hypothetical protein
MLFFGYRVLKLNRADSCEKCFTKNKKEINSNIIFEIFMGGDWVKIGSQEIIYFLSRKTFSSREFYTLLILILIQKKL